MLLRKAVGTCCISGPLHIPMMGSPSDFPISIFGLMVFIYVSCQSPPHRRHWRSVLGTTVYLSSIVNSEKYFVCVHSLGLI